MDGGSTDDTMKVVEKYRDQIDIIIHEKDKGQTDAINKGFKSAKGELVGWLNSDDTFYPDCIEKIVELYLSKPDGAIFYGSKLDFTDENGKVFKQKTIKIPDRQFLLNENYDVLQQSSFYSNDMLKKINYLNQDLHYCMDLDLWINLLEHGSIHSYNERRHDNTAASLIYS